MKTKNLFLSLVVLITATTALATKTPKTDVLSAQGNKILVNYETAKPCLIKVTIADNNGVILHEWKPENPLTSVKRLINLQELEDGIYQFSLKSGSKSLNSAISIDGEVVKVEPLIELNEPYFAFKDGKLFISFLNQSMKHVYLNVYSNGEYYNGFDLGKDFDVQKCVDFSTAKTGTYEIVLTDNFKSHNFTVNK